MRCAAWVATCEISTSGDNQELRDLRETENASTDDTATETHYAEGR